MPYASIIASTNPDRAPLRLTISAATCSSADFVESGLLFVRNRGRTSLSSRSLFLINKLGELVDSMNNGNNNMELIDSRCRFDMGDRGKQVIDQSVMPDMYLSDGGAGNALPMNWYVSDSMDMTPISAQPDPYTPLWKPVINSQSHDPFDFDRTDHVVYPRGLTVTFDDPKDQERWERTHGKHLDRLARIQALHRRSPTIFHPNAPMGPHPTFREFAESFGNYEPMPQPPHDPIPMPLPFNIRPDPSLPFMLESHAEDLRRQAKSEENGRKCMRLLAGTENFYAGEWKRSDMAPIMNGIHPAAIKPSTIAAAEYAVSFLNKQRDEDDEMKLKQLIRVNWQFRRCSVYWLTIEASDDKFYEALVLVSDDEKERVLKFIRPAKYYPEIPAHLHHLIGPPPREERLTQFRQPDPLF